MVHNECLGTLLMIGIKLKYLPTTVAIQSMNTGNWHFGYVYDHMHLHAFLGNGNLQPGLVGMI